MTLTSLVRHKCELAVTRTRPTRRWGDGKLGNKAKQGKREADNQ